MKKEFNEPWKDFFKLKIVNQFKNHSKVYFHDKYICLLLPEKRLFKV